MKSPLKFVITPHKIPKPEWRNEGHYFWKHIKPTKTKLMIFCVDINPTNYSKLAVASHVEAASRWSASYTLVREATGWNGSVLWEKFHCYACGTGDLSEEELAGTGELTNYTVVYYPPRDFLGQEPYVVGHITMDEGVLMPAPIVGVAPDDIAVGTRVKATLRRMKLGHEGDIYYSQKFVVDPSGTA